MKVTGIVLAAGVGKRMNSAFPKVLHKILGRPMISYPVDALKAVHPERIVIVAGKWMDEIKKALKDDAITYAIQKKPMGTADALLKAKRYLGDLDGTILLCNADTPLITHYTLKKFLNHHRVKRNTLSFISFNTDSPSQYGRVIRDESGRVCGIVEDKDATKRQKEINEVNSGIYAMEAEALSCIKKIQPSLVSGEYYLTDMVEIIYRENGKVGTYPIKDSIEAQGINTRADLSRAIDMMRARIISKWMDEGVTFIDAGRVFVEPAVLIGRDTIIYPNVYLEGNTAIGQGCTIYPNVRIIDSSIGDDAVIKDSTLIEESRIEGSSSIGPFAHIRPRSIIGRGAKIGNFVEVKKSTIGSGSKAMHLSYLGDASIGDGVNIGAGAITCNYDGRMKHKTVIEDMVFIGSDSQLVAPVRVGKGAYIAAGSTITRDVPAGSLAISRAEQRHIEKWALRKKTEHRKQKTENKKQKTKNR